MPGCNAIVALRRSCSMLSNLTAGWILFLGDNNRLWRWLQGTDWNHRYTLTVLWVFTWGANSQSRMECSEKVQYN